MASISFVLPVSSIITFPIKVELDVCKLLNNLPTGKQEMPWTRLKYLNWFFKSDLSLAKALAIILELDRESKYFNWINRSSIRLNCKIK